MTTLGIDLAVRAAHVATLTDDRGEVVWTWATTQVPELATTDLAGGHRRSGRVPADELTGGDGTGAAKAQWVLVAMRTSQGGGREGRAGRARAVRGSAPLLHQAHEERPARLDDAGPAAAAASRRTRRDQRTSVQLSALKRAVRRRVRLVEDHLAAPAAARLDAGPARPRLRRRCSEYAGIEDRLGDPGPLRRPDQPCANGPEAPPRHSFAGSAAGALDLRRTLARQGSLQRPPTKLISPVDRRRPRLRRALAWDLASEVRCRHPPDSTPRSTGSTPASPGSTPRPTSKKDPDAPRPASAPSSPPASSAASATPTGSRDLSAAVRGFSGMVPQVNQSGNRDTGRGVTKQGDPGLRRDIWFAAEIAPAAKTPARREVLPLPAPSSSDDCTTTRPSATSPRPCSPAHRRAAGATARPTSSATTTDAAPSTAPGKPKRSSPSATRSRPTSGRRSRTPQIGERANEKGVDKSLRAIPPNTNARP